jgi:acyl dehydratase
MAINCGFNKVRFLAPVLVDSDVRLAVRLDSANEIRGGFEVIIDAGRRTPANLGSCLPRPARSRLLRV